MRTFANLDELTALVTQEVAVSDWLGIDQERVNGFAEATGDRQWIHVDAGRAQRESPYKTTIAHGFLTLSLLPHFLTGSVRIEGLKLMVNYGLNRVRFPAAVPVGARVRARLVLGAFEGIPGGAQVEWLITVEIENQTKPACVAALVIRCYV
jgi:acyl dehydratase